LLRELDAEHIARTKTVVRIKKEEDAGHTHHDPNADEVLENLRTIELEAIQYLAADYQPTRQQSDAGIQRLVNNLASYDLTKAEKLQIVNLAPTEPVELYVIVEELEDRLGGQMEDILGAVSSSLDGRGVGQQAPPPSAGDGRGFGNALAPEAEVYVEEEQDYWQQTANDVEFDDMGEGAGIEGDLDVDDD